MIRDRIAQLIYRAVFLTISVFGIIESFGLWSGQTPSLDCFLYYTSLSNFLCFGVTVTVFVSTLRHIRRGETHGCNTVIRSLKFYTTIAILVTFIVYNFILADNMFELGWNSLGNITKHIVCPLLFVFDFLLFDEHHALKWYDCLLCTILPLVYASFILIRGAVLPSDFEGTVYPYFFLDGEIGYGGVFGWIGILLAAFLAIAAVFYLYDKVERQGKRFVFYFKQPKGEVAAAAETVGSESEQTVCGGSAAAETDTAVTATEISAQAEAAAAATSVDAESSSLQ